MSLLESIDGLKSPGNELSQRVGPSQSSIAESIGDEQGRDFSAFFARRRESPARFVSEFSLVRRARPCRRDILLIVLRDGIG